MEPWGSRPASPAHWVSSRPMTKPVLKRGRQHSLGRAPRLSSASVYTYTQFTQGTLTLQLSVHQVDWVVFLIVIFRFLEFCFMCISVLPACMSMHHVRAWCPQRSDEAIGSPGTGVTDGCELPRGYREPNKPWTMQGQHGSSCWATSSAPERQHLKLYCGPHNGLAESSSYPVLLLV